MVTYLSSKARNFIKAIALPVMPLMEAEHYIINLC